MRNENKSNIIEEIDRHKEKWTQLSLQIHDHPELSFQEYQAMEWLTEPLFEEGFRVQKALIPALPTSFIAEWEGPEDGPVIGMIAEYDALADLGHACGHNIIGTSAVSAAAALKNAVPDLPGKIVVIGTPAEEEGGGKIMLAEEGWFDALDAAMMCHPRDRTMTLRGSLACVDVDLAFHGRSAHAAANPDQGISALDAMIQSFIAVKQILPALHQSANIHGIITKGGEATNVIPDHCEASFLLRAETTEELGRVKQRFYEAVGCSTQAMGASYSADEGLTYAERINNHTLAKQFQHNLEAIGVEVDDSEIKQGIGSSDIGNVSHIVPTIHPYINIGEAVTHTHAFTEATRSEKGMDGLNQSSKALALTAYDLLTSRELVENAKTEWKQTVSKRS